LPATGDPFGSVGGQDPSVTFNKSTHYALCAAVEMARAGPDGQVTVGQVAQRYEIPGGVLAKVFQRMVRSGIAVGTRGTGGGYRLARRASEITVLDVLRQFESAREGDRPGNGASPAAARLGHLLDEVDELVRCTFASVSLEVLAR
jgi:Rrf2 family protein